MHPDKIEARRVWRESDCIQSQFRPLKAPMLKNFARIKPNYGNAISKIGLMPISHNSQPDSLNE